MPFSPRTNRHDNVGGKQGKVGEREEMSISSTQETNPSKISEKEQFPSEILQGTDRIPSK